MGDDKRACYDFARRIAWERCITYNNNNNNIRLFAKARGVKSLRIKMYGEPADEIETIARARWMCRACVYNVYIRRESKNREVVYTAADDVEQANGNPFVLRVPLQGVS